MTTQIKILVVTHSYGLNGAAAQLKSVMHYWAKTLNWTVDALVNEENSSRYGEELRVLGVNPVLVAYPETGYQFVLINTITDIEFVNLFYGKLPIILWVHDGSTALKAFRAPPIKFIELFNKCDLLIFNSDWQIDEVFKSFIYQIPRRKVVSISGGAEIAGPIGTQKKGQSSTLQIVCLGSVYPRKRQSDLAQAVVNLSKSHTIECTFIGSLDQAYLFGTQFNDYFKAHDQCLKWAGGISEEEKNTIMANSDVACFPSGDETFNIAALEAALFKLPVILADLPVYNYVGWQDGENCLKYPVEDIKSLERVLQRLIDDPLLRAKISEAGYSLATRFNMNSYFTNMTRVVSAIGPNI